MDYFWFKVRPRYELRARGLRLPEPKTKRCAPPHSLKPDFKGKQMLWINKICRITQISPEMGFLHTELPGLFFEKFRRYHSTVLRRVKKNQSEKVEKVGRVYLGQ
jgi:hypothetical protein